MGAVAKSARADNVRLNQLRAKEQAAERRRRLTIAIAATAAVVVVVAVLVGVALFGPKQQAVATGPLDPAVYTTLSTVPVATFDQVGAGSGVSNPPKAISAPALTTDGKPGVLYVGAEYCPFCAAERWPFVVAMTRFGQFANLQATASGAAPEAYPNTATLSFHGASYTSQYLGFTGVETQTNTNQPLDTLSRRQQDDLRHLQPRRLDPLHRLRRQGHGQRCVGRPVDLRGQDPGADRRRHREPLHDDLQGRPRQRQRDHRAAVRAHQQPARTGVHLVRRHHRRCRPQVTAR